MLSLEIPIKSTMPASGMPSLTISVNRQYLDSHLEDLNRDFGHTYSAEKRFA